MGNKIISGIFATLGIIMLTLLILLFGKAVYDEYTRPENNRFECCCDSCCEEFATPTCLQLSTEFVDVEDVTTTQAELLEEIAYVDQFKELSPDQLTSISIELFKRKRTISLADIINEYIVNRAAYNKISKTPQIDKPDKDPNPVATDDVSDHIIDSTLHDSNGKLSNCDHVPRRRGL